MQTTALQRFPSKLQFVNKRFGPLLCHFGPATVSGSFLQVALFAAGTVLIGWGLQTPPTAGAPLALWAVTLAGVVCAAGLLLPGQPVRPWQEIALRLLFAGALAFEMSTHVTQAPGIYLRLSHDSMVTHHQLIAWAAVASGLLLSSKGLLRTITFAVILVLFVQLGLWLLHYSPSPHIDVFSWHAEAYSALRQGENPYALQMPNIYGNTQWYGPGLADASRVFVGYPYPPLTLALGGLGHLFAGDYRYANLAMLAAAGALLGFCRNTWFGQAAAALLLFSPKVFFVLEQGWTESSGIFVLALVVFCACRSPQALPWAFGLLLSIKQYFVLALPLVFLLHPVRKREDFKALGGFLLKAVGVAAVVNLPFFLWDPHAFFQSVVAFQSKQPFRSDALSWMAHTAQNGVPRLPNWLAFALVPLAWLTALRAPRTPASFAAATGLLLLLFFGVAKQAFTNYYFLALGALAAAAAAVSLPTSSTIAGSAEAPASSKADNSLPKPPY